MRQAVVDGRNVLNTYAQMYEIIEETRKTNKPILVEMQTYRFRGHSMSDPQTYRSKEEVERERSQDCLQTLRDHMVAKGVATDDDFDKWEEEISEVVEDSVVFAEESPEPELHTIYDHVLAP